MTLFKNATLVEFDPARVREGTDLLVEDDVIKEVGRNLTVAGLVAEDKTVDAGGKILFPGLVCSHHHMYSGLARGIMADIGPTPDFVSILRNLWWRLDRAIDEASLYSSGLICSIDAIRAGTTAVIDHHASPQFITGSLNVLKKAFEETGLRGATCYEVSDRRGRDDMIAGVEENVAFAQGIDAEKAKGTWSGLTEAHIGGHAPVTLPDEALKLIADACEKTGRGFHVHLAEDRYDVSHSHATYGKDLIPRLDSFGLLSDKTLLVHGVHLSSEEIAALNERDSFLIHNARSNMNNNVGYTKRIPEVKNLGLGTDGIGADMFEEIKAAYFKHKDEGGAWWPGDFLGALAAGNRLLERVYGAKFGRIEPGYKADLVVANYLSPTPLVPENIAGHMVFGMGSGVVETVMVNGRLVMEDRIFSLDIAPIYEEARGQAEALWGRMNGIAP
ncbi:MAG: putative aminohydrolase SsnA [Spirochaetales bacterium]|nr:putative aminohydrolase SsnA [Spirochaetales bacterium]